MSFARTSSAFQRQASPQQADGFGRAYGVIFWSLLALFEVFLLTLPLIPNGDGPVHLYLSSILWKVATHSSPLYEHAYAIRHLVQPYSFHYYFLIALGHVASPDNAEKAFAGLIWATLAIGFRSLARTLAQENGTPAASLLIFALLFSWPFSAGFFNFTFGCGLLLFALSFYLRLQMEVLRGRNFACFFLTLVLLVLAHPIPIMVLICIIGLDLGLQLLSGRQMRRVLTLPVWQTAALGLACVAFVFPILIADKSAVASSMRSMQLDLHLLPLMLSGIFVSYFQVHSWLGWTYQALIVLLLPVSIVLFVRGGLVGRLKAGAADSADRLLCSTLLFLAASLFLPETMNGSAYFAARMWYIIWLLLAVCLVSAGVHAFATKLVALFGVAVAVLSLVFGLLYLRPVALQQAELERAPLPVQQRGLFIQGSSGVLGRQTHTWWALAFWDGVRAFTAHQDVLLNTPWLQLTIVPVRERDRAGLVRDVTPNSYSENPSYLLPNLLAHPEQKAAALALTDFILFADPNGQPAQPMQLAASLLGTSPAHWLCRQHDFYAICEKN